MKDDREEMLRDLSSLTPRATSQKRPVQVYSHAPLTKGERIAKFKQVATNNDCTVVNIDNETKLPDVVCRYLKTHHQPLTVVCEPCLLKLPWQATGIEAQCRPVCEQDHCGITTVTAATADSAAMLQVKSHQQSLSLLPPYHVAVLQEERIVENLSALWALLPKPLPYYFSLFCGPSRTADIEQTLTLGVHGPIAVLVVLISSKSEIL